MRKEKISILGCGWVGLEVGREMARRGFLLRGSYREEHRRPLIQKAGIIPHKIVLGQKLEGENLEEFFCCDFMLITLPPEKGAPQKLPHQLSLLFPLLIQKGVKKVFFISSTSVYGSTGGIVREDSPLNPLTENGKAIKEAEELLNKMQEFEVTILRFSGLIGYDRDPGRFLAGRKDVSSPLEPVNLVHRDDGVSITCEIIQQKNGGGVYNICADEHPMRGEYYRAMAKKSGLPPPHFRRENSGRGQRICNEKVKHLLSYHFKKPLTEVYTEAL